LKKYLVIGNPIEHSLSPKLHNYWFKENNINAVYEKKKLDKNEIKNIIDDVRKEKIAGINVTVPFKKEVLAFLDQLTTKSILSQSVNTIFKEGDAVVGDNTDIGGFKLSLKNINYEAKNKKVFILGAGGVAPSIILALKSLGVSEISLSNRTKSKAEDLKKIYPELKIIEWGEIDKFDMIINTTSLGLKIGDKIKLDFSKIGKGKMFYDVIYNPEKTNFLAEGQELGNYIENGKMMFIYQAQLAFNIWHNILPKVHDKILNND
jgi:shikimate dehydrogenase